LQYVASAAARTDCSAGKRWDRKSRHAIAIWRGVAIRWPFSGRPRSAVASQRAATCYTIGTAPGEGSGWNARAQGTFQRWPPYRQPSPGL